MNDYFTIFENIDFMLGERFGDIFLPFNLIGYAALAMAGLPERGTKDVDALEEALKTDVLSDKIFLLVEGFLKKEFGRGSAGNVRFGLYLDLVPKSIPWMPPRPRFIVERRFAHLSVSRLHPTDTCVSKTFSNFKRRHDRASDRKDILSALDAGIMEFSDYVNRLDKTFPYYEAHAEAPEVFPRVIQFVDKEICPAYGTSNLRLTYEIPSWMENMQNM